MSTLNVKNFPDDLYRELKARARREGRSLAREVTILLTRSLLQRPKKYTIRDWPKLAGGAFRGMDVEKHLEDQRESW